MKNASRRRAFTLIEIVIVCAVIAILAAILLGVFQRVRENGQSSVCQSNLHQLSLALQQYVQDNDSRFPTNYDPEMSLASHVKDKNVFHCPTMPAKYSEVSAYVIATWLQHYDLKAHKFYGRHEAIIPEASTITSLSEIPDDEGAQETIRTSCGFYGSEITRRHSNGSNYAFVDGHVKWFSAQQWADADCKSKTQYPNFYKHLVN